MLCTCYMQSFECTQGRVVRIVVRTHTSFFGLIVFRHENAFVAGQTLSLQENITKLEANTCA